MARGDGKALKGRTKGTTLGVKRMATGGFAASSREGGFAAAGPSRLESPGQRSSVSPGGGNVQSGGVPGGGGNGDRLGASTRDGGFGGVARNYPDDRRVDLRSNPNTFSRTERTAAMTSPDAMKARLGPNAAQAMLDAGVDPETARLAAESINRRATDTRSILGDPNPGQRLATANRDGSFSYSPIQRSTFAKNQTKQIYDRILPEDDTVSPLANYAGLDRGFGAAPTTPTTRSISSAPTLPSARMTSAQDMASVVPGSVSFTQRTKDVPFAETALGKSLLARSKQPMTEEQAKAFAKQMPAGSNLIGKGLAAIKHSTPPGFNQAQYNSYPAKIEGYDFSVNVPKSAVVNTPYGPKIGQYNPAAQQASPLANYTGQEQRFAPAPVLRGQEQRYRPASPSTGTPSPAAQPPSEPRTAPPSVVGGRNNNFGPAKTPYDRERGGGRDDRPRRKKPIIGETAGMKSGGVVRRDGAAMRGKTKGRCV